MWNKNAGCNAAAIKRFTLISTARPLCAAAIRVSTDWANAPSQTWLNA